MCSNTEKEIVAHLLDLGCCLNCSVRYLGDKQLEFSEINDFLRAKDLLDCKKTQETLKKSKSNPCIVCVGLLEDKVLNDIIESSDLKDADSYDSPTFSVSISMPASVLIREHSMRIHVTEKFASFYANDIAEIPINRVWKMFVKNALATRLKKSFICSDVGDFFINIITEYADDEHELQVLRAMQPAAFLQRSVQHRKYNGEVYTRKGVLQVLEKTSEQLFKMHAPCPPTIPTYFLKCKQIACKQNACFVGGRYCKYSRDISQSPWLVDGVKIMDTSVQEIIFETLAVQLQLPLANFKFASSGREDCDVRCLGKGRPFYVEISDLKKTQIAAEEFRRIEAEINRSPLIHVRYLQRVPRTDTTHIKHGEDSKTKVYSALCVTKCDIQPEMLDKLNNYGPIVIRQNTPIRVLHRRSLAVRERTINYMKAKLSDRKNCFTLEVQTQAGTYVKEFVHGDFGRTTPSVSELLQCEVDIAALDVIAINLDWPLTITTDTHNNDAINA